MRKEESEEQKDSLEEIFADLTDELINFYIGIPLRYWVVLLNKFNYRLPLNG
jgi:hypothetical protein